MEPAGMAVTFAGFKQGGGEAFLVWGIGEML